MGLEDRFFKWEGWDEGDSFGSLQFYDCVFTEDIGPFKKGDKADTIFISFEESKMCVYQDGKETRFVLTLNASLIDDE